MPMIMVWEHVFVNLASTSTMDSVFKELLVVLVALVKLTAHVNAMLVLPTMEVFVQDAPVDQSTALKVKLASMFVARTQFTTLELANVFATLDMVFSTVFVTTALKTTSSAMDTVSLALSIQFLTKQPTDAIVLKVSTPIKPVFVLPNAEPTRTMTPILNNVDVFKAWEKSMVFAQFAPMAQLLLLTDQVATSVVPMKNLLVVTAFVRKDMPTTQAESALFALHSPMVSSLTEPAQFAQEVLSTTVIMAVDVLKEKLFKDLSV